jgi:DNA end-binding protein Ku
MARSLWTGSLSFGLVNVPVQLVTAVRDLDVHFHQLHEPDTAPIDVRRFCSEEDTEVPYEEIAHSYELDDGREVIVTDDDLVAAAPRKTRTIDIEEFVDLADVDPMYFDHPYFLVPRGDAEGIQRAYRLLVEVMVDRDRAALGRMVLRTKEHLVAIRVRDGALALTTMLFHDELRAAGDVDTGSARKPAKRQVDRAVAIVQELSCEWEPERHRDRYRERLQKVIADKQKGRTIKAPKAERAPGPVPDLMAALEQTLEDLKS